MRYIHSMSAQVHSTSTATDCKEGLNFKLSSEKSMLVKTRLTILTWYKCVYLFCWPKPLVCSGASDQR